MNDAKQNYAAVAESEFDLRREVVRLRDINKDLLEALRLIIAANQQAHMDGDYVFMEVRQAIQHAESIVAKAEGK